MQTDQVIDGLLKAKSTEEIAILEKDLKRIKDRSPDGLLKDFFRIISDSKSTVQQKQLVVSQMKNLLSEYSDSPNKINVRNLKEDTVVLLRETFFSAIGTEENNNLRKQISEVMGEVGATLYLAGVWIDLVTVLWRLFEQQKLEVQESAFIVLRIFIKFCHSALSAETDNLNLLISNGLSHTNLAIKIEAIRTLGVVLEQFEKKMCTSFSSLVVQLLETIYSIILKKKLSQASAETRISEDLILECVGILGEIAENEASFFQADFDKFYVAISKIVHEAEEVSVQRSAIEALVYYLDRIPESLENDGEKAESILQYILLQMVKIDMTVDEDWKRPQLGFNNELVGDERAESVKFGMNMLSIFVSCCADVEGFQDNQVLLCLLKNIQKMLEQAPTNSGYGYAAMMALSQIGEFTQNFDNLEQLMKTAYDLSYSHSNPLMRYGFCHIIGQVSEDLSPQFQETFGEDLIPKMILFLKDPVERVRAHAAASLINFLDGIPVDILRKYIRGILDPLLLMIETGIDFEKEMAISAISTLVESSGNYFEEYLSEVINKLLTALNSNNRGVNYQGFCGNLLECITIIATNQRKSVISEYLGPIANALISYTESSKSTTAFPVKHIFDSWSRFVSKYSEELASQISIFFPTLLQLLQDLLSPKEISLDVEDVQSAIKMISIFSEKLQVLLVPFIDEIFEAIASLCKSRNEQIRECACKCVVLVLRCAKGDKEKLDNILPEIVKTLKESIENEHQASLIVVQLESMASCIQEGGEYMSDMEFELLCHQLMRVLSESDARKTQFKQQLADADTSEVERQLLPIDYKLEEQLHVAVARVLGSIYRSHPVKALVFSAWIYTNIAPKAFQDPKQVLFLQFGMILLQDIVKYIGFARFDQKWDEIILVFLSQTNHPAILIKKEALHGLSAVLVSTPSQYLSPILPQICSIAQNIIVNSTQQDTTSTANKGNIILKESATDILGKLVKLHGALLPNDQELTNLWIQCLPITLDKQIADDQHQIYLQYLLIQIDNIQNENQDSLLQKFKLLSDFYNPKVCTPFMKPTLDSFMRELMENQLIATAYSHIALKLTKIQQNRLASAFKGTNVQFLIQKQQA